MSTRGDSSWRSIPFDRRKPAGGGTIRLTLGSLLLILLINALISLFISLAVFFVLGGRSTSSGLPAPSPQASSVARAGGGPGTPAAQPPAVTNPGGSASVASGVNAGAPERTDLYVVKSGDSLSAIAGRYGLTMAELMAANGLQNPDWIAVGQKLTIPVPGAPTPTATVPPVPTLTETPLPFEPPTVVPTRAPAAFATFALTEPAAATPVPSTPAAGGPPVAIERVSGAGNVAAEEIVIASRGKQINMEKWTLSDSLGNTFTFPNVILWSSQAPLRIHTGKGVDTPTDLFWNRTESVWKGRGELATLRDANGTVIDTFKP